MAKFLIKSHVEKDEETGEPLYWSNEDGWVFRSTATPFEFEELNGHMPMPQNQSCYVATMKPGHGYWNISMYPYGGSLHRAIPNTEIEIILGFAVKYEQREVRAKLPTGEEIVIDISGLVDL